jgi:hypothetical protein
MAENPLFCELHRLATERFGPHEDRRFSFGNTDALTAQLKEAGFRTVTVKTIILDEHVADPRRFIAMNLNATVDQLDDLPEQDRTRAVEQFQSDAAHVLARYRTPDGLHHPVSANMVMARP